MNYAIYLRVSTQKQGRTMLGIDAQRKMCEDFIRQHSGECLMEFMDVESGTHRNRKGLWDAIAFCQRNDCSLVIAKLDRLARDVEFTFKVINTGIDIHFTDMPVVNSMILGVFAAVAQYEREMCSSRTKQALAVKKAHGVLLGAASEKYKESRKKKSQIEIEQEGMKRGQLKKTRWRESRDIVAFRMVLKAVFPQATEDEDPKNWKWWLITTRNGNKDKMLALMRDYKKLDVEGKLFLKWDFDADDKTLMTKLCSIILSVRRSYRS